MITPCPDVGSNPGPLDCKSYMLPTELCGPLSNTLFKDVYNLNDVSNDLFFMIIRLSVTQNKVNYQTTSINRLKKKTRLSLEQHLRKKINKSSNFFNMQLEQIDEVCNKTKSIAQGRVALGRSTKTYFFLKM